MDRVNIKTKRDKLIRKTDPIRFYNRPSDFHENFTLELQKIYSITNDIIHIIHLYTMYIKINQTLKQ